MGCEQESCAQFAEPLAAGSRKLPSMHELMAWNEDGICETPTGHRVEPDGTGPDGVPSWLRALRLI